MFDIHIVYADLTSFDADWCHFYLIFSLDCSFRTLYLYVFIENVYILNHCTPSLELANALRSTLRKISIQIK